MKYELLLMLLNSLGLITLALFGVTDLFPYALFTIGLLISALLYWGTDWLMARTDTQARWILALSVAFAAGLSVYMLLSPAGIAAKITYFAVGAFYLAYYHFDNPTRNTVRNIVDELDENGVDYDIQVVVMKKSDQTPEEFVASDED